jgi:Fic family protein
MMAKTFKQYDDVGQFEPLFPREAKLRPLLEKAGDLVVEGTKLASSAMAGPRSDIRRLLRNMNSYYTNRIEGEHTRPTQIEEAMRQDFSKDAELARKQRLAVSHIETELHCESHLDERRLGGEPQAQTVAWLYSTECLEWLHHQLFDGLEEPHWTLIDGSLLEPGRIRRRKQSVKVGRHVAPTAESLPRFLDRWATVYAGARRGEAAVAGLTAAHHRLAWIHPFMDGNGRVARLHTHLLLHAMGLTGGLWSPLRGFARAEDRYKALLCGADEGRHGDLDGRGNLTEKGLIAWMDFVLDACLDQVEFMRKMLDIGGMKERIAAALTFEEKILKTGVRIEALNALHYLFATQAELPRAEFKAMTGLGERVATSTLSALVACGYLKTDTPYGPVRFGVPLQALRFYFPALWPEAEVDVAQIETERREAAAKAKAQEAAAQGRGIDLRKFPRGLVKPSSELRAAVDVRHREKKDG